MTMWLLLFLLSVVPQDAPTVVMPNVIGMTVPQAEAALADASLRLGRVTEIHYDKVPRGIVFAQGPGPGRRVRINFECEIVVSKGPKE